MELLSRWALLEYGTNSRDDETRLTQELNELLEVLECADVTPAEIHACLLRMREQPADPVLHPERAPLAQAELVDLLKTFDELEYTFGAEADAAIGEVYALLNLRKPKVIALACLALSMQGLTLKGWRNGQVSTIYNTFL
jgi:hypothetical protein